MKVEEIPEKMRMANQLAREHLMAEKKYLLLSDKLAMAELSKVSAESAPPSMRVIEYAHPPEKPGWPNKKLLLAFALVAGLVAGVALALLLELLNARVDDRLQSEPGGAVYATVAQDRAFVNRLFRISGKKAWFGRG